MPPDLITARLHSRLQLLPAAEVRRRIEARDGFRCRVPGCQNAVPLENSHVTPHREGVPATEEYIGQHCASCNTLIEAQRLTVKGLYPFEEYWLADGTYLGVGYDPTPRLGDSRKRPDEGESPPESRRKRPA